MWALGSGRRAAAFLGNFTFDGDPQALGNVDVTGCVNIEGLRFDVGADVNRPVDILDKAIIGTDTPRRYFTVRTVGYESRLRAQIFGVAEIDATDVTVCLQI